MPRKGAISGEAVEQMVKNAVNVHENKQILEDLEDVGTSCQRWGHILQSLFVDGSVKNILDILYSRKPNVAMQEQDWAKIEQNLEQGRAVLFYVKLPGSRDHVFTIVANKGRARIVHAWQNHHPIRAERSMPIKDMISLLKKLPKYSYANPSEVPKIQEVCGKLWGLDHMGPSNTIDCPNQELVSIQS